MADIMDNFFRGFSAGSGAVQSGREYSLRLQELKSQQALRQLQERHIAQQMADQAEKRNDLIQYRADMTKAVEMANVASAPTLPIMGPMGHVGMIENPHRLSEEEAAIRYIIPVLGKYQPEKVIPATQNILTARIKRQEMGGNFTPTSGEVYTPDGRAIPYVKTGRNSAQLVPEPEIVSMVDPTTGQKRSVMKSGASGAKMVPDDIAQRQIAKSWHDLAQDNLDLAIPVQGGKPGQMAIPVENLGKLAARKSMTGTTRTALEKTENESANMFGAAAKLFPMLNANTVGLGPQIKSMVIDRGLGQLFPGLVNTERVSAQVLSSEIMTAFVKSLKSDGNIAEPEAKLLRQQGELLNWTDEVTAKTKLAELVSEGTRKAREATLRLGKAIDPKFLTPEEIAARAEALVNSGDMSPESAEEWSKKLYYNSAAYFLKKAKEDIANYGRR